MKEYATMELRRLQRKYINENGSQKRGMMAEGPDRHKHMTSDELFEARNVLQAEPRIGRLANDRKKANELIAMPRGLLNILLDELGFLIYCEENIDAVPVVRCKDCLHCRLLNDGVSFECAEWEMDFYAPHFDAATYYCADGKRRDAACT